jgi:hypothetical protein
MVLKDKSELNGPNKQLCLDNLFLPDHTTMDALKAEIASKRKALENVPSRPNKYMRRGDIERMREEEERKAREEAAAKKAEVQPKVRSTPPL